MSTSFKVVDLFAGPGGLAEGFSALEVDGSRAFEICLSVEKESSAFATLRLRSFVRQFNGCIPRAYYDYIAGKADRDHLISAFPQQWMAACKETEQLELGAPGTDRIIDPILDRIREDASENAILVGGPPCQAYSLVGRSRNSGIADYKASEDKRHFLYREYIRIIGKLRPAAFVMENVKGFLSSKVDGDRIFSQVVSDLCAAGGAPDSYRILPLVTGRGRDGSEYILRAEQFGIPQRRHRVILFGIRSDLAPSQQIQRTVMRPQSHSPMVEDVLRGMPPLRSGLSRTADTPDAWRKAARTALLTAARAAFDEEDEELDRVADRLRRISDELESLQDLPPRSSGALASVANNELAEWLVDPALTWLPNHEARGHMESDLARYAFASAFAEMIGRSPKAGEFPKRLAPAHGNWESGKFVDRFRAQCWKMASTTITSHISKDGHYFIHPDPLQCRSLTVREAARLQTFPDNYFFEGNRTQQYVQVGNAVPPLLARQIADVVYSAVTLALRNSSGAALNGSVPCHPTGAEEAMDPQGMLAFHATAG